MRLLAGSTRDIALAEDAVADAFERALRTWPERGVPVNPEGWLLTVARNRIWDRFKVVGDAQRIGNAFGVSSATMAQRLVRAKRRIRDAGIPFRRPSRIDMADRLLAVLEAIYGASAIDWLDQNDRIRESTADEARHLAVMTAELLGDEPEAWGLAALLTFAQARAPGRAGAGAETSYCLLIAPNTRSLPMSRAKTRHGPRRTGAGAETTGTIVLVEVGRITLWTDPWQP